MIGTKKGIIRHIILNQMSFVNDRIRPSKTHYSLVGIEGNESKHLFNKEPFDAGLTTEISMRANKHETAGENICSAQEKQRRD